MVNSHISNNFFDEISELFPKLYDSFQRNPSSKSMMDWEMSCMLDKFFNRTNYVSGNESWHLHRLVTLVFPDNVFLVQRRNRHISDLFIFPTTAEFISKTDIIVDSLFLYSTYPTFIQLMPYLSAAKVWIYLDISMSRCYFNRALGGQLLVNTRDLVMTWLSDVSSFSHYIST